MNGRYTGLAINVVLLAVAAVLYPRLPETVPTHWNMAGEVDGTMPKFPGAFLPSLMGAGLTLVLPFLRRIDPRSQSYERFEGTFRLAVNAIALLLAWIQVLTLAVGLGYEVDMVRWLLFAAGLLFVVLGNALPRIRSNWWMGIRTPWTLESEEVWRRTHRVGGWTFVAGGLITMLATLLPREQASKVALAALVMASLAPAVYSYVIYRGLSGRERGIERR